jgi:hypothetical protein
MNEFTEEAKSLTSIQLLDAANSKSEGFLSPHPTAKAIRINVGK